MPTVNSNRYTYLIANGSALYPSEDLYPSETLYPSDGMVNELFNQFDAGTLVVSELLIDGNLKFGVPLANKFECTMFDRVVESQDYIQVYQRINNVDIPIFCGKIDSAKWDRGATYKQVIAYDKFYELSSINVADWWETFWEQHYSQQTGYSATLKQIRDSFVTYFNLEEADTYTLVNDSAVITKSVKLSNMAFKDMMRCICELSGVIPNITRDGKLEYVVLDSTGTVHNMDGLYEGDNSEFENYATEYITGIHFLDSNGESKMIVGNDLNTYTIEGNILTFDLNATQITTIGQNLLNAVKTITYTPCNVNKIISDWDYRLGDYVITNEGAFYIFENTYSGSQLIDQNIKCTGDEFLPNVEHSANPAYQITSEKIARLEFDVDGLEVELSDLAESTTSRIEQTAEHISTSVAGLQAIWDEGNYVIYWRDYGTPSTIQVEKDDVGPAVNDYYLDVETGRLHTILTSAKEQEEEYDIYDYYEVTYSNTYVQLKTIKADVESQIIQLADSITLEVTGGVGQQAKIKLSVGGEPTQEGTIDLTGIVKFTNLQTAGQTIINGANISTGYINCDRLNGGTISGQTISGGTVSGTTITSTGTNTGTTTISGGKVTNQSGNHKVEIYGGGIDCTGGGLSLRPDPNFPTQIPAMIFGYTSGGGFVQMDFTTNGVSVQNNQIEAKYIRTLDTNVSTAAANVRFTTGDETGLTNGRLRRTSNESSIRYKYDFKTKFNDDLDPHHLYDLKIYQYKYQTNYLDNEEDQRYNTDVLGFIAENVNKHYPIACDCHYSKKKDKIVADAWNPNFIIPPMLSLIQEQHQEIETLKKEVADLKEQMALIIEKIGGIEK